MNKNIEKITKKIVEKIVNNKEILIPIFTKLAISFVGSYMAISLFMNIHGLVPKAPPPIMMPPQPPNQRQMNRMMREQQKQMEKMNREREKQEEKIRKEQQKQMNMLPAPPPPVPMHP